MSVARVSCADALGGESFGGLKCCHYTLLNGHHTTNRLGRVGAVKATNIKEQIMADEQYNSRNMIQTFPVDTGDAEKKDVGFVGVVPVIGEQSLPIHHLGPDLGEHNHEILAGLLQLSEEEIAEATATKESVNA